MYINLLGVGGRRPGKFLGELLLHVKLFHDTAMKQPRRSPDLRRIRECDFFLLGFPAHNSSQYHHRPALTSQHLSSPLPLRPTSFWSPAHWFPQGLILPNLGDSHYSQDSHPLSRGGVTELSGSGELIAEALEVLRVDNSLLSQLLPRNI